MSIYEIDFEIQIKTYLREKFRKPDILAFVKGLIYPLNWLRKHRLYYYIFGTSDIGLYKTDITYNLYDTVIWTDGAIYLRQKEVSNVLPGGLTSTSINISPSNKEYWYKVLDSFIGVNERMGYSSTLLSLEYMLNRWFATLNPTIYTTGAWNAGYPDKYNALLNKPKIWIEQKKTDDSGFLVGLDEPASSKVGLNNQMFVSVDFVGIDFTVSGNSYGFIVNYPTSLIFVNANNQSNKDLGYPTNQQFIQLEALINKHKHISIDHAYKSYQ